MNKVNKIIMGYFFCFGFMSQLALGDPRQMLNAQLPSLGPDYPNSLHWCSYANEYSSRNHTPIKSIRARGNRAVILFENKEALFFEHALQETLSMSPLSGDQNYFLRHPGSAGFMSMCSGDSHCLLSYEKSFTWNGEQVLETSLNPDGYFLSPVSQTAHVYSSNFNGESINPSDELGYMALSYAQNNGHIIFGIYELAGDESVGKKVWTPIFKNRITNFEYTDTISLGILGKKLFVLGGDGTLYSAKFEKDKLSDFEFVETGIRSSDLIVGKNHLCVLSEYAGRPRCWKLAGENSMIPVNLGPTFEQSKFTALAIASHHACGIEKMTNKIRCTEWSTWDSWQKSQGEAYIPAKLIKTPISQIALGDSFSILLKEDGQLECLGELAKYDKGVIFEHLGREMLYPEAQTHPTPVQVADLESVAGSTPRSGSGERTIAHEPTSLVLSSSPVVLNPLQRVQRVPRDNPRQTLPEQVLQIANPLQIMELPGVVLPAITFPDRIEPLSPGATVRTVNPLARVSSDLRPTLLLPLVPTAIRSSSALSPPLLSPSASSRGFSLKRVFSSMVERGRSSQALSPRVVPNPLHQVAPAE